MTEEQILSKDTYLEYLRKSEVEQIEFENKLHLQAKRLGIDKELKSAWKKYEKAFKGKISIEESNRKLPKSKYNIENYKMGKYICDITGITDTKTDYKFSFIPVFPVERYINIETGKEKVKIIFYKENKWQEKIVDRSQLSINQKLLQLSDYGLDVTSENVRYYINYFSEIMSINDISKLESVSHLGWQDNEFIPYDSKGIFDGADDFRSIYNALSVKGQYDKWYEVVKELRKSKIIKLLMATTLAAPLLEKLSVQPYIVNLWSSISGNGKTLSCMVAMSIWGNPEVGALRLSSNNTKNFYITTASFMRNLTCYFDELQIIKNSKELDTDSLIMDLCNGTEKGRLTKNSEAREIKTWFNNFLFTSNDRLVKENAGEHIYNRVIDLEINEKIIEKGQDVARIIKNNYGYAGKRYMEYIKNIGFEAISGRFEKIYTEIMYTKATSKQASALATILLANELANECIFKDDYILQVNDIVEYINDKDEIKTSVKAKEYIISLITANENKFDENNRYGECWGSIKEKYIDNDKYYRIKFNINILYKELGKGGFDFNTVKKEWADEGFIEKNSQGKYVHQTTVNKVSGSFVVFMIQKIEEN